MDRRTFASAGAVVLLGVPLRADAQRAGAMPRIGPLTLGEGLGAGILAGDARSLLRGNNFCSSGPIERGAMASNRGRPHGF